MVGRHKAEKSACVGPPWTKKDWQTPTSPTIAAHVRVYDFSVPRRSVDYFAPWVQPFRDHIASSPNGRAMRREPRKTQETPVSLMDPQSWLAFPRFGFLVRLRLSLLQGDERRTCLCIPGLVQWVFSTALANPSTIPQVNDL